MTQVQFLGRTALNEAERTLIAVLPSLADHGQTYMFAEYLEHRGLDAAEAALALADPESYVERLHATLRDAPELTRLLADAGAGTHLVDGVQRFGEAVASLPQPVLLDRCAIDDSGGGFEVAYYVRGNGVDVGDGDLFHGGFTLMGDAHRGTLTAAPRLVRQICTNGQTQLTDTAGDACSYTCDADGQVRGELDLVLEVGVSRDNLQAAAAHVQQLKARRVSDAVTALEQYGAPVPRAASERVQRLFEAGGDPSLYGALNALTQTARDSVSIRERARLEVLAGRLLPAHVFASDHASF